MKYGIGINHITMKYFTTGSATCAIIMESAKDFFASGFILSSNYFSLNGCPTRSEKKTRTTV